MYSHFEFFAPGFPRVLVNMVDAFSAMPYIEYTMFSLIRNIKPEVSQSVEYQSMARPFGYLAHKMPEVEYQSQSMGRPCGYLAHKKPEEDEVVDDEEDEEDEGADDEEEDADDETYNSDDQYADMPPLISVDHCPCTPNRRTTRTCPQLPKRFEKNEIIDDGPCNNTRSAKRSRLNNSQSVPSHLFFD